MHEHAWRICQLPPTFWRFLQNANPRGLQSFSVIWLTAFKITHMLLNFLIGHCEFPVPRSNKFSKNGKKRKFKYRPAFSIKDSPIYEMNPHSAEGNKIGKKTDFCKMLVVDPYIPEYCQKHQFEFLYFPSHLLPMKVWKLSNCFLIHTILLL